MRGSIALVGSGEFLPIMADFEKSLINDGVKTINNPPMFKSPPQQAKKAPNASNTGSSSAINKLNFYR